MVSVWRVPQRARGRARGQNAASRPAAGRTDYARAAPQAWELRKARDGENYTFKEFYQWYGAIAAEWHWGEALQPLPLHRQ